MLSFEDTEAKSLRPGLWDLKEAVTAAMSNSGPKLLVQVRLEVVEVGNYVTKVTCGCWGVCNHPTAVVSRGYKCLTHRSNLMRPKIKS